jgi:GTP pyrophosphokinase
LKSVDDLYASVGAGDVRVMTVVNYLSQKYAPVAPEAELPVLRTRKAKAKKGQEPIIAEGVGNLMSQIAKCCQPVAGESIVGYITQGKGVSVHKEGCMQLQNLLNQHPEREIDIAWSIQHQTSFQTELDIYCLDRSGILRDITTVLSNEKVSLLGVNSSSNKMQGTAHIKIVIEVTDAENLARTAEKLRQINDVSDIVRP